MVSHGMKVEKRAMDASGYSDKWLDQDTIGGFDNAIKHLYKNTNFKIFCRGNSKTRLENHAE